MAKVKKRVRRKVKETYRNVHGMDVTREHIEHVWVEEEVGDEPTRRLRLTRAVSDPMEAHIAQVTEDAYTKGVIVGKDQMRAKHSLQLKKRDDEIEELKEQLHERQEGIQEEIDKQVDKMLAHEIEQAKDDMRAEVYQHEDQARALLDMAQWMYETFGIAMTKDQRREYEYWCGRFSTVAISLDCLDKQKIISY